MKNRVVLIVIDSCGMGALPDAKNYGDIGADTLGNIDKATGGLVLPNLHKMGLYNLKPMQGMEKNPNPIGCYTKSNEVSNGKDTLTGHWEMVGIHTVTPFKTFTENGFPKELIDELEAKTGHQFIGNYSSSGTEILDELGAKHAQTKALILYTSADSVLQIAANEDIIPLEELYRVCEIAREITLKDEYKVGRIIARPFLGQGPYQRTTNRHDYALNPPCRTILDALKDNGLDVVSVGKINDIFSGNGITETIKTKSNAIGMTETIALEKNNKHKGLIFVNLVDFDSIYGHRRDPEGYKKCLQEFDFQLGELLKVLDEDTLLIVTADHGNDPTMHGSDHTREWVPVLIYNQNMKNPQPLTRLESMADIGMSILDNFNIDQSEFTIGKSFINLLD
ncbi:MAG: phosphopentomutase [Oscillospiraceae bacterium]